MVNPITTINNLVNFDPNKHLLDTNLQFEEKKKSGFGHFVQIVKRAFGYYDTAKIDRELSKLANRSLTSVSLKEGEPILKKLNKLGEKLKIISIKLNINEYRRTGSVGHNHFKAFSLSLKSIESYKKILKNIRKPKPFKSKEERVLAEKTRVLETEKTQRSKPIREIFVAYSPDQVELWNDLESYYDKAFTEVQQPSPPLNRKPEKEEAREAQQPSPSSKIKPEKEKAINPFAFVEQHEKIRITAEESLARRQLAEYNGPKTKERPEETPTPDSTDAGNKKERSSNKKKDGPEESGWGEILKKALIYIGLDPK